MRILFVIKSSGSSGELQQAITFASQLDPAVYETWFFINQIIPQNIYGRNNFFESDRIVPYFSEDTSEIINVVQKIKPDLVICSEQHNIPQNFKEYLSSLDICKAGLDGSGQFYESAQAAGILFGDYTFIPCPVSDPLPNEKHFLYWDLYPGLTKSTSDQDFTRKKYKLRAESKIILFSIGPWAYINSLKLNISYYYSYIFALLTEALAKLDFATDLVIVSPIKNSPVSRGNLNVHYLDTLDNKIYDRILMGSDLVISDNLAQNSLVRAFMAGINTLSLVNQKDYLSPPINLFKFEIFPVSPFIPPLKDYEYFKLLPKAEIFDKAEVFQTLEKLLTGRNVTGPADDYRQACHNLTPLGEILKTIL